jgi:hypothetical protein
MAIQPINHNEFTNLNFLKTMKLKLLYNLVLALLIGTAVNLVTGFNTYVVAAGLMAAPAVYSALVKTSAESGALSITVQIWQKHIEEEIFKDNSFMRKSHNVDEYVLGGKIVHIPQSGGSGNVVKNRTSLPASVRQRTDTTVLYALDAFTTDPVLIPNVETKELTYDKRNSVLGEDLDNLKQEVAEATLYNWVQSPLLAGVSATALPSGNKFVTSGASVAAQAPMTGNRLAATRTDLQVLQNYFRSINRWVEGKMHIMLPPAFLMQLYPADSIITATLMQSVTEAERRAGIMMKDLGFNIMSRSSVLTTTSTGTVRAPGETGAVTDGLAAIAWYEESVELALGTVDAFEKLRDPQFYGDVYSFEVRVGGRARRSDYAGIAILRQGTPA